MNALKRMGILLTTASLLAVVFSAGMGSPRRAYAGCGSDTTWHISSETTSRQVSDTSGGQTTNTQDWTSNSVQVSDDGQTFTDSQTFHGNADGSSTSHEEMSYEDQYGNGCNSDGEPWTGRRTRDEEQDAEGNRKEHIEEIIEKDGKCIKHVRDREWDRKGKLIKDTGWVETEVPCVKYNLEVLWEGSYTPPNGFVTAIYGPDTALIPLGLKNGTYTGSHEGQFHATATGMCNATAPVPVTFDITAKEDEFGDLEFTITRSYSFAWNTVCPGASGASTTPIQTITDTFILPSENGASKTFSNAAGGPAVTYTLKK